MQTVCAPFVPQAVATDGKNLPAVVFPNRRRAVLGTTVPETVVRRIGINWDKGCCSRYAAGRMRASR